MRRKRKSSSKGLKKEILSTVMLLAAVCVFVFSVYQLVMMLVPYYVGGKEYDEVKELALESKNADGTKEFKVDFDELLKKNPDTVAWLRFDQPSVISYPVVKSADNNEYLTKTFSANENKLGAIFMDKNSASDFSGRNTFIYGHNLKQGGEMFSQLNDYAKQEFCEKNPNFYIYTPDGQIFTYKVFSASVVQDNAENYRMDFASDEDYMSYLQMRKNASNYQVDVELTPQSQVVSLSTCTNVNDDERFLLHGVLVQ